ARRAEQARLAEEARRLEEARKAENARREEEARRRAEETKRQEEERRRAREAEAARVRQEIETNTSRARECLDGGDLVGARRAVEAALSLDAVNAMALRIGEEIASETRRRDAEVARQEEERRQEA